MMFELEVLFPLSPLMASPSTSAVSPLNYELQKRMEELVKKHVNYLLWIYFAAKMSFQSFITRICGSRWAAQHFSRRELRPRGRIQISCLWSRTNPGVGRGPGDLFVTSTVFFGNFRLGFCNLPLRTKCVLMQ